MNDIIWTEKDLGPVDCYAEAVEAGYTGTKEQWLEEVGSVKENATAAAGSATNAADSATAAAGSAKAAAASAAAAAEHTAEVIEGWLDDHVDPETGYVLDRTLEQSDAAAPADMVGALKSAIDNIKKDLNGEAHTFAPGWHYGYVNGSGVVNDRTYDNANRYSDMFFAPAGTVLGSTYSKATYVYSYNSSGTFVEALGNFKASPKTIASDTYIRLSMELATGDNTESFDPNVYITVTVPYEKYALITQLQEDVAELQSGVTELEQDVAGKQDTIKTYQLLDLTIEAGIYNNQGNIVNAQYSNYTHTLIELGNTIFGLNVTGSCANGATYPLAVYFDNNGNVIGTEGTTTGAYIDRELTIPNGCKYVGISNDATQYQNGISASGLQVIPITDYIGEKTSPWYGKKIVWFGTSIPAGVVNAGDAGGNGAYPTRVGEMLGATVYNEAVGSSAARIGDHASASESDPNGYAGVPATCCLLSLSGTVAEKEAILEDWDTWKEIFIIGVDQIDTSDPDKYLNCSYERKLDKYLTGGSVGPVDLYVFDHGYNDAGNNNGVNYSDTKVVPTNALDRTYFIGAMNFLIDRIKQDNFRASIVIISHYNDEGQYADLIEAQQFIADKWNIPFINISNRMGFSTARSVTIGGTTKTMKNWWLPDTIHPSSDTTGKALQHYAEVLYPFIRDAR